MARGGGPQNQGREGGRPLALERRYDVATFGETMIRLSAPSGVRLPVTSALSVHAGGAESNVAADLAQLGRHTTWYSALPDHAMGDAVVRRIAAAGVDVSHVKRVPGTRVGVYYLEGGLDASTPEVIYDRQATAFSCIAPGDLPLAALLDTRVLHVQRDLGGRGRGPPGGARSALGRGEARRRLAELRHQLPFASVGRRAGERSAGSPSVARRPPVRERVGRIHPVPSQGCAGGDRPRTLRTVAGERRRADPR